MFIGKRFCCLKTKNNPPMKKKKATITISDEEGNVIKEIPMSAADGDWLRASRL